VSLPEPFFRSVARGGFLSVDGYTAEQLHAYVKEAVAAERRRCANVCFERALTVSKTASAWAAAMACADDIRQLE
jgi:hypothetical protein